MIDFLKNLIQKPCQPRNVRTTTVNHYIYRQQKPLSPLTKIKNCGIFDNLLVEYSAVEVVGQEQGGN
jgi:hypothetical protein